MNDKSNVESTIDAQEVEKFSKIADEWWDEYGKFRPLHQFNPCRIEYIRSAIEQHRGKRTSKNADLSGVTILDVGCGGGLLSVPLTRLGARVTGIDASEKNIAVASLHGKREGLEIDYRCIAAEKLAKQEPEAFDVVLCMEVIEHVADMDLLISSCCKLLKPGGQLFLATLNKTIKSYLMAIVGAEYVLGWLPRGTHDWRKFVRPAQIAAMLRTNGVDIQEVKGANFHPLSGKWSLSSDSSVNYIVQATKPVKG